MLKNFLIICVCVCLVISLFGLANRWNYDNLKIALENVQDESDVIRDDFNIISVLSYYWSDRISISSDDYNNNVRIFIIPGHVADSDSLDDGLPVIRYVYGVWSGEYQYSETYGDVLPVMTEIYRMEDFVFLSEDHWHYAYNLISIIVENNGVLDWESSENILTDIAFGVVFLVQSIGIVIAMLFTFIYFVFDIFMVTISVLKQFLWLVGFIN